MYIQGLFNSNLHESELADNLEYWAALFQSVVQGPCTFSFTILPSPVIVFCLKDESGLSCYSHILLCGQKQNKQMKFEMKMKSSFFKSLSVEAIHS